MSHRAKSREIITVRKALVMLGITFIYRISIYREEYGVLLEVQALVPSALFSPPPGFFLEGKR
jgi:hypothetical protein